MTKNIFVIRHAESTANVNYEGLLSKDKKYVVDQAFGITKIGKQQAFEAGRKLGRYILIYDSFKMYVSPYLRTRKTSIEILKGIKYEYDLTDNKYYDNIKKEYIEDPRLVEQDFGDFDFQYRDLWPYISPHSYKINQAKFIDPVGRFFARLENGENLLDVYNRVSLFTITRLDKSNEKNSIIVTHGNTQKIFKMFFLNEPVESFEKHKGPYPNASIMHFVYDDERMIYTYLGLL